MVLVATLATAVSVPLALRLKLDSNLLALLPEKTPTLVELDRVLQKTGGAGELLVMFESTDADASVRYAQQLLPKMRALPWVKDASIGQDTTFFERHKLLYADLDKLRELQERVDARIDYEIQQRNPLYLNLDDEPPPSLNVQSDGDRPAKLPSKYNQSPDGRILIMVVHPRGVTSNLSFARRIHADTEKLVRETDPAAYDANMRVSIGGTFRNRLDEYETIVGDVESSAVVVAVLLMSLLVAYFRRPLSLVLAIVPLLAGMGWTFGATYFLVGKLNVVTVFLLLILLGLGIDFSLHMVPRYRAERARGQWPVEAMAVTLSEPGRASVGAALTTAVAFYFIGLSGFRGFSDFGLIAGTGMVLITVSYLVMFPALAFVLDRHGSFARPAPDWTVPRKLFEHPVPALALALIATVASAGALTRSNFDYDLRNMRSDVKSTRQFNAKMRQVFGDPRDASVVLVDDPRDVPAVVAELERRAQRPGSAIAKVRSMQSLLPADQEPKLAILAELRQRVGKWAKYLQNGNREAVDELMSPAYERKLEPEDLPKELRQPFVGEQGGPGQLVFVMQRHSLLDLREALRFAGEVRDIRANGKVFQPASEPLAYSDMVRLLRRDTPLTLALALLAVWVLIYAEVRKVGRTALVMAPLALGLFWMVGAMALSGYRFNMLNIVVLPSILGLGVDNSLHIYRRFEEVGAEGLPEALRHTTPAAVVCIATSVIGFGGMLGAEHPGLRSIAVVALLGLSANLVASFAVVPAMLRLQAHVGRSRRSE